MGKFTGPKVSFGLTLLFGSLLSLLWFGLHWHMTSMHYVDSEVINFSGRLRYLTQKVGSTTIEGILLQGFSTPGPQLDDTLHEITTICANLLGDADGGSEQSGAPEMLDESVKAKLRLWLNSFLRPLQALVSRRVGRADASAVVASVQSSIRIIDGIVGDASEASQGRVHTLLLLSISRACLGVVWALVATCTFGSVWRPYAAMFRQLQVSEQLRKSLLRAAFDVVIQVHPTAPFNVVEDSPELCHLAGKSMQGESLLAFADGAEECEKLRVFLARELETAGTGAEPASSGASWWWNLSLSPAVAELPVGPMIPTQWRIGLADQTVKVQVLVVGCAGDSPGKGRHTALLAVKVVEGGVSPGSTPPGSARRQVGDEDRFGDVAVWERGPKVEMDVTFDPATFELVSCSDNFALCCGPLPPGTLVCDWFLPEEPLLCDYQAFVNDFYSGSDSIRTFGLFPLPLQLPGSGRVLELSHHVWFTLRRLESGCGTGMVVTMVLSACGGPASHAGNSRTRGCSGCSHQAHQQSARCGTTADTISGSAESINDLRQPAPWGDPRSDARRGYDEVGSAQEPAMSI